MTCRACHEPICGCPDARYAGVIIDDPRNGGSEPGSWARHIRHTGYMRNNSIKANHGGGEIIARPEQ